jgi:hypothetical protein
MINRSVMIHRTMRYAVTATLAAATVAACGSSTSSSGSSAPSSAGTASSTPSPSGPQALVGTFKLTAGACTGSNVTGSYFRMIVPGGTIAAGKFFDNPDSLCADKSYTVFAPGTDGGFETTKYQPNPSPAFDTAGNALAASIVSPTAFTAIKFGLSTNAKDPQTGKSVPAPIVEVDNGKLSGQVQAWSAQWNHQSFNQGSPKPGGTSPGLTGALTGTYDPTTKAFVLTWASQVVGGPFNGFTGSWHLQGTFTPAS